MKNKLNIEIEITENTEIYSSYNSKQLSEQLSNHIYNQCKGESSKKNMVLNINHSFKMNDDEKTKLVDAIRANYGIDIKENLLKIRYEHIKEIFFIILGVLLLIISNFFDYIHTPLIGEIISIFGCVSIWEVAYNIIFVETQIGVENRRLKKLTEAKINFNEIK